MEMHHVTQKAINHFLDRLGLDPAGPGLRVFENPSEEIDHVLSQGKKPKLYGMANGGGVVGRLEENYLYYTRRFPSNVANNTIGSGAVVAGDYPYFSNGLGDQGSVAGYFSLSNLTLQQTNMASAGKIPNGRGFKLFDLGVSFNAGISPGDLAQCLDVMNLRYDKAGGSLVLQHGPVGLWPGGTGIYGFGSTTATTTTIVGAANGMPALTNARRFRNPRVLAPNDSFQYIINISSATVPKDNTAVALLAFVEARIWLFGQVVDRIQA